MTRHTHRMPFVFTTALFALGALLVPRASDAETIVCRSAGDRP